MVSDKIKRKIYHELAHASHFAQVGDDYWEEEINYTIANGGYGDGTAAGAGRAAIVEAWGYHIGPTYADRRYGLEHSNTVPPFSTVEQQTHLNKLEALTFWSITNQFIPIGIMHDLIDDNAINIVSENSGITDNVKGFSNNQIYLSLTSDVISPEEFKEKIVSIYLSSTSNTIEDTDNLFDSYNIQ